MKSHGKAGKYSLLISMIFNNWIRKFEVKRKADGASARDKILAHLFMTGKFASSFKSHVRSVQYLHNRMLHTTQFTTITYHPIYCFPKSAGTVIRKFYFSTEHITGISSMNHRWNTKVCLLWLLCVLLKGV